MKLILVVVALAIGGFYGVSKWADSPSTWRSSYYSAPSTPSGRDLRVDTPQGKMYPGLPKFGQTTINGKRYVTVTTIRSR